MISAATDDTIEMATAAADDSVQTLNFAGAGPAPAAISRTVSQPLQGVKTRIDDGATTHTVISTEIENFSIDAGDGADMVEACELLAGWAP